jgi:hypothetical protein
MSIDVNAIEQTVEVTAVGDEINVNVIDQPVLVSVTDQIIEVAASGGTGPQGPAGAGVAAGGTTGQVLSKASSTNYDTVWVDAGAGTVYSVNASGSTGISVTGGPITGAGTLTITNTAPDQIVGLTGAGTAVITGTYPNFTITTNDEFDGTVTSVDMTVPTGLAISGNPITSSGTLALALASGYSIPTTANQANWTTAYNDSITSASVSGTSTKTLTLNQQDGGTIQASWTDDNTDAVTSVFGRTGAVIAAEGDYTLTQLGDVTLTSPTNGQVLKYNGTTWVNNTDTDTGLTSVGLSMPVAFSVANTPLTSNGTLAVSAVGTSAQYIRGDGQLATLPTGAGGGSSVNYYLNGSVNQGTIGGSVYYEMNRTPVIGAGTDFALVGNGLISQFLTDVADPNRLEIPAGAWNFEMYFSASSSGGTPAFYVELLKYDSTTFTSIASSSAVPEAITSGTIIDLYLTSLAIPQTTLLSTDRLAIRVYIVNSTGGRTITMHTENSHLCEIITNFAGGVSALNGLTANTQYFATGTSGTDFAINSLSDTHTFNLPIASATNTGKLSNSDWNTFTNKQSAITLTTFNASGSATFVSSVLNIPTYTLVGLGGEPAITAGAITQYFRGDKTFQTLDTSVVPENSNLYYTDTRARNAITLTTTGSSGASTYSGGFLNIPIYSLSGLGGVPTTRTITINGTTQDLSADRSFTIPVHDAVTIGTANGLSLSTQVLSLGLASSSANGALSSTDWSTFNGKQNTITLTTTGTSGAATLVGATLNIPQYADQFVGTVTSVAALTLGTTGTDLSSTVSNGTTTPVITLNVPTASATNRGALSSTDWTTFNNKQAALNGTGFVKISGTTISYDNSTYALDSAVVHNTGTETIAGTKTLSSAPKLSAGLLIADGSLSTLSGHLGIGGSTDGIVIKPSNAGTNNILFQTGGFGYTYTFPGDSGTVALTSDIPSLSGYVTGTGTTNYLPKWTSGSALGNSQIFDNGTNVGIGFATPTRNLDVNNELSVRNSNDQLLVSPTGTGLVRFFARDFTTIGDVALGFFTGVSERARISSDGNFGIGTTSPAYKLDVYGDARFGDGNNFNALIQFAGSGRVAGSPAYSFVGDLDTGMFNPNLGNTLSFSTAGSERMRLDASGNLGLGVVPSAWTLGPAFQILRSSILAQYNATYLTTNAYYGSSAWTYIDNDYASQYYSLSGQHVWRTAPSGTAGNAITFTQAMTLTSGGNLIVGSTFDSGERLQVTGSAKITGDVNISGVLQETVTTTRQTASYTLALADNGKLVEMNVATANNLTVPLNSSVAFPIGTKIDIAQYGAGQTTVVATSGVTVRSAAGALKLAAQYSGATLVKIATDEWYLFGDITV